MASLKVELTVRDMVEAKLLLYELVELRDWLRQQELSTGQPVVREAFSTARVKLERALLRFKRDESLEGSPP
jgi:hypothetical protein